MYLVCMVLGVSDFFESLWSFLQWPGAARSAMVDYYDYVMDLLGLDPIYVGTVIVNLVMISYWKQIKNFEKQPNTLKGLIISSGFGAVFVNFICLLRLFGIGGFDMDF